MLTTDIEKVAKIMEYCNKIDKIIILHNNSKNEYISSFEFQLATDMCIFQIGEISIHISDDFKNKNNLIPWNMIKGMRNIHAHDYEIVDRDVMWSTITKDVPKLKELLSSLII